MAKKIIHTSYFAVAKHLPAGIVQCSIALTSPNWWQPKLRNFEKRLNPDKSAFKKANWRELYEKKMLRLSQNGILQIIVDRLSENSILLCWERDADTCHRQICLNFMIEHCGVIGSEFVYPLKAKPEKKPKSPDQSSLF